MTVKVYWYIERQYKKIKQFVRCIYTNDAISDVLPKYFFLLMQQMAALNFLVIKEQLTKLKALSLMLEEF